MARKQRVNRDSLLNSGRAGDVTFTYGVKERPEDSWSFFHKHVDNPTYMRFAASACHKGSSNPHARRKQAQLSRVAAETQSEAATVAELPV